MSCISGLESAIFTRNCKLPERQSFFLFGARGTGKTSLLRLRLPKERVLWLDLLDRRIDDRYAIDPGLLYDECKATRYDWVVIDEVQKLPGLLDTVHRIIETVEFAPPCFALTGSSARKLRHGGANLLAGRAFLRNLHPITHREAGDQFDLIKTLNFGSLPKVFSFDDPADCDDFLTSYRLTYLNEEVWAEHLVQNLDPFRKFLEVSAQSSGTTLNYATISRDVQADEKTVKKYFQILADTLLGFFLEPFHRSVRKRQSASPKFYLFDLGVKRTLERTLRQPVIPGTYAYGRAFEHLVILEAHRLNDYQRTDFKFSYFLTKDGGEVDLVVERPGLPTALIEIKSAKVTNEHDTRYLRSLRPDFGPCECYCLSLDPHEREVDGVKHLPWAKGLIDLGL